MEYPGADLYNVTATPDRYQYNGKEWNDELGEKLMDYGARWYDPWASRWLSPDPLTELQESFSPYHYTYDNPIRYNDPDGRMPEGGGPGDPPFIPSNPIYMIADAFGQGFKEIANWVDKTFSVGSETKITTPFNTQEVYGGALTTSTGVKTTTELYPIFNGKLKSLELAGPGNSTSLGWFVKDTKKVDFTESSFSYKKDNVNNTVKTTTTKKETTVEYSAEGKRDVRSVKLSASASNDGTVKTNVRGSISKGDTKGFLEGGVSIKGSKTEARAAVGAEYKNTQGSTISQSYYVKAKYDSKQ